MQLDRFDHLVLTVRSIPAAREFYEGVLGMESQEHNGRWALHFGRNKVNLHEVGHEFEPKADRPTPGSADLCFICDSSIQEVVAHLEKCGIALVEGLVSRSGALGKMESVYLRDPDRNLLEISVYDL